ncbi:MAG: glycosyltransferase [Planctomycetota bacterium]
MTARPAPPVEISIVVSTYQRPQHLSRCLTSIAAQRGADGRFEVVVCDDGSTDSTHDTVQAFADGVPFRVAMTTHPHDGFRLSRCRNEGAAAARAPYLLFTDGDCLLPPDHIATHLRRRRPGRVMAGDCYRLDQTTTQWVGEESIYSGAFQGWAPESEKKRIRLKARRGRVYSWLRVPMRPRLTGSNIAVWAEDLERINGFDEQFVGWGWEDRDLQRRLSLIGVRSMSILPWTQAYHLWHEPAPSFSPDGVGTNNRLYYEQSPGKARCDHGLAERRRLMNQAAAASPAAPSAAPSAAGPPTPAPGQPADAA